ncbi:MAG: chemotaxis protein CheA [Cyanobacteria bacterium P01_H01_bin.74]
MASFNDDALLIEFVTESKEHLASIEPDLLALEKNGRSAGNDIINSVFRAIHSIKGAAGFFGLEALKSLSHVMESVLMMVRDGTLEPTSEVMDPLLVGVDKLNLMLDDIGASESVPYKDEVVHLEALMGNGGEAIPVSKNPQDKGTSQFQTSQNTFQVTRAALESASKGGHRLYIVSLVAEEDLVPQGRSILDMHQELLSVGMVLDCIFCMDDFDSLENCLDTTLSIKLLCSTVLEHDLLALSIKVDESKVLPMTVDQVMAQASSYSQTKVIVSAAEADEPDTETQETTPSNTISSDAPMPVDAPAEKTKPAQATAVKESQAKPGASSAPAHDSSAATESIRVRVDLLNRLMDLAGEMVLSRNQLIRTVDQLDGNFTGLDSITQNIDLVTSDLQEHIMQTRMQPVGSIFGKFPRIIRDMSKQLSKEIVLQTSGEDVELDKTILESLSDPLTHLIRNCCDHAIEMPDERIDHGKPATGTITLKAFHEGGQINITISDNGRGIDHEKVAKKVVSQGVMSDAEVKKLSTQEMVNLIFMPGLSTAEKVSDISGRGVGMDVVRTNIEKIGGTITIDTTLGKGTTISLRLPLTLAIIPSLIVGTCENRFAVPQVNLVELVCVKAEEIATKIEKVGTAAVLRLRGKLLPLVRLSDILELERNFTHPTSGEVLPDRRTEIADPRIDRDAVPPVLPENIDNARNNWASDYNILVLKVGDNNFGLIVDQLFDMEEIVVKPLSNFINTCKTFAGATIMGDGQVAMILDAGGILAAAKLSFSEIQAEENRINLQNNDDTQKKSQQAIILFNNAVDEVFALPLSTVLRLEKFSSQKVEQLGNREFLSYQNKSIEIFRMENHLPVRPCDISKEELFLILPKAFHGRVGIVASKIVDTLELEGPLDTVTISQPGISGSAVINDHLTVFIDPEELLRDYVPVENTQPQGLVANAY